MQTATSDVGDAPAGRSETAVATTPRDWLAGERWSRRDVLTAAALGVVVTVLTFLTRTEIVPTDPWHYIHAALTFPSDNWVPLGYTRYGMILPIGPLVLAFGNAEVTYYFWPLLSAGLLASSVYLLGRRWFGVLGGLLAVVLLLSNPVVLVNLSRGYPDVISMALFCLAMVFALVARDRLVAGARFPWLLLLVVGFLLGWGFEARETSLLGWPIIALVLWRRGTVVRTALTVLAPLAVWAAADIGIGAIAYHDPLLKLHTFTHQDLSTGTNPADEAAKVAFVNKPRLSYLTVIPKAAVGVAGGFWMNLLGVVALLGLVVRHKPTRLMALWFLSLYLLFVGIGGMFSPAHPGARLDVQRYWVQFFPAGALAVTGVVFFVAGLVARLVTSRRTSGESASPGRVPVVVAGVLALAVAVGPVVAAADVVRTSPVFATNGGAPLVALRDYMASRHASPKVVWSDWETVRLLPIYQRGAFGGERLWGGKVKSLTGKGANPQPGDYVVLHSAHDGTCSFCRTALAPWAAQHKTVPASWVREFATPTGNLVVYRVS